MGLLEVGQLVFQAGQLGAQLVCFLRQEHGGFAGTLGALLDVLIEKQRDQFVGHLFGNLRALVLERYVESNRRLATPFDEGTEGGHNNGIAHQVDLVELAEAPALVGKQVVLVDDPQQVLAGHYPLANDFNTFIGITVVVRRHQLRRNLLRFHQNGAGRLIDRRDGNRDHRGHRKNDHDAHPQQQGPVLDNGYVIVEGQLVFRFHRGHSAEVQRSGNL
ncbi:hypothetical protein D3C80_775680 [compost metagenome]